ncbi:MAG: HD domain-containing protein [Candidatus Izemoplasmataceae bacterium]
MELTKEKALQFIKDSIEKHNRPSHPFRSRYRHTLRVLMWVERLQKELGGDLEILTYSTILHDCAWNDKENHAVTSYRVAKDFLDGFELEEEFKSKVLEGVLHHNQNDTLGLCKESYILMDADELDEVGAICIFWDTLAENHENDTMSYKSALLRIKRYIPDLYKNIPKFHFDYALDVYNRKLKFMEDFIKEAEEELEIELI